MKHILILENKHQVALENNETEILIMTNEFRFKSNCERINGFLRIPTNFIVTCDPNKYFLVKIEYNIIVPIRLW